MSARPVVLDVDTGVDDALAILLALRSPECSVQGICTVSGNAPLLQTTANTCRVLDLAGAPAIPVAAGAAAPLVRSGFTAGEVHGGDGLGGMATASPRPIGQSAATRRSSSLRRSGAFRGAHAHRDGPVDQCGPGDPAERRDHAPLERPHRHGGAIRVPGNVGPVSEFNFAVDPEAAAIVLDAGLPVTLVPLDVTERVTLTRQAVDAAALEGAVAAFVRQITAATMAFHRQRHGEEGIFSTIRWRWASPWIVSRPAGTHGGGDRDPGRPDGRDDGRRPAAGEPHRPHGPGVHRGGRG